MVISSLNKNRTIVVISYLYEDGLGIELMIDEYDKRFFLIK